MYLKLICVLLVALMFFGFVVYVVMASIGPQKTLMLVNSPTEFIMEDGEGIRLSDYTNFDTEYTEKNKELAKKFNITEDEAFIIGNLGKYWAKNIIEGRKVRIQNGDLLYYGIGYVMQLEQSPYCIKKGELTNKTAFYKQLSGIRKGTYTIRDLDTDNFYPVSKENRKKVKNFVIIRKSSVPSSETRAETQSVTKNNSFSPVYTSDKIKIIVSDLSTTLKPNRDCTDNICKELLNNINKAQNTIDMAIYGYSSTPAIEKALEMAQLRGVKIRFVYDTDSKGENIYPDTPKLVKLFADNKNDGQSTEVNNTMHNKFYIFDGKTVITGSANLSHTDMSGFNTNAIIVFQSPEIAKIYENEFNQMYDGKFHHGKTSSAPHQVNNVQIFFSPQDKTTTNGILPLIRNAKEHIYVSAFVITDKNLVAELINAKSRGVEVKIIADSLNASAKHSKHKELRGAGIPVKAENYAGKMHSKTIEIDNKYLVIGSMNFSNSGENFNDENVVILQDSGAGEFIKNFFEYQWNKIPDRWLKYTPRAEGKDSVGSCTDGIDNNYDGLTDSDDPGCRQGTEK